MRRVGFAIGVALVLCGGIFMPPLGLALGVVGVALALVSGWGGGRSVVASGALLGVPLGVLGIATTLWWGNGHHTSWSAVQTVLLGGVVLLLGYIALLLRRGVAPAAES